ncbi:MAG: hypothetical protein J6Y23_01610 [Prevotella sp.]|nr:hypothetical protein [Prevotella sp.]
MMLLVLMAAWTTMSMGGPADVLIGNFYYSVPNGIAFIKSDEVAFVIDPVLGENRHKAVLFDDKGEGFAQAVYAATPTTHGGPCYALLASSRSSTWEMKEPSSGARDTTSPSAWRTSCWEASPIQFRWSIKNRS